MFPEEVGGIRAFFDEAKETYEECYSDLVYGVPLPAESIAKVLGEEKLLDYPREHLHFYDWLNKTYKQKLDEFFADEDLKALLCPLLGYFGTKSDETPASNALTAVVSYYLHGGYYPKGGAQKFANALRDFIECLKSLKMSPSRFMEFLGVMRICRAIQRSSKTSMGAMASS